LGQRETDWFVGSEVKGQGHSMNNDKISFSWFVSMISSFLQGGAEYFIGD